MGKRYLWVDTMFDAKRDDLVLGVVGAGLMGRGIAQIAALAGIEVLLFDQRQDAAVDARKSVVQTLDMLVNKGRCAAEAAAAAGERIIVAPQLSDLGRCHCVIEAIVEDLAAKTALFQQLESIVPADCVLTTNTSSLSVSAIAAGCQHPERVAGFHFFSPVPLMKLVEVIEAALTAPAVAEALTALARRMGHTPVRAQDTPGFIVNHAGRGYITEALRTLSEGVAEVAALDRILKGAVGFRLGPFELLDLTGLDVSHPVMESIYNQYYQEPRYRPSVITRQRLSAGLLGRKSGRGFYRYPDGKPEADAAPERPLAASTPLIALPKIWISRCNGIAHEQLASRLEAAGVALDNGAQPAAESACIVLPVGQDATTAALAEQLDPKRTVAVDPLFIERHLTLMSTPVTDSAIRDAVWRALAATDIAVTPIRDSAGFVVQRVVAMIVNIACDMAQQAVATPADIDRAVTLGLAYPQGPLALGDLLGAERILAILDGMYAFYRDPRYRPSPWLIRRARLGVSLLMPAS